MSVPFSIEFAAALSAAQPGTPAIDLSGSATLVSEYRFRGIALSDRGPALQLALTATHPSGVYGGAWASNTDGFGELGGSNLELDLYAGWKGAVVPGLTLDAGVTYYAYPGSKGGDFEYFEPYANVSTAIGPTTVKAGGNFAPAQAALGGTSNLYLFVDTSTSLGRTPLSITTHVGRSKGNNALSPGGRYWDWSVGLSATLEQVNASLAWVDTDIGRADAAAVGATRSTVSRAIVASVGVSF